jgi:hypothetical protein
VFLLGNWKNYDQLEEELSIDELLATLDAYRKQKRDERKFLAALQGIDIDREPADIVQLSGYEAAQEGFGIGMGLGHAVQEVVSS